MLPESWTALLPLRWVSPVAESGEQFGFRCSGVELKNREHCRRKFLSAARRTVYAGVDAYLLKDALTHRQIFRVQEFQVRQNHAVAGWIS
ncbi:hypothetical protein [Mesorhizobium sp. M0488]|uniref:hypothetical protein n=1 Tax=unclassified Mesorhizobium TaxID=325217 RepID=UPI00333E09D7